MNLRSSRIRSALPIIQDSLFLNDSVCWYIQKDRAKYHIIRRWNSQRRVVSTPRSADKHEQEAETADFSLPLTLYIFLSLFLSSASAPSPRSSASLDCWLLRSSFTERIDDTRVSDSRSRLYSTRLDSRFDSTAPRFFSREKGDKMTTMTRRNREIDVTKRLKGNWHSREMHVAPNVYESTQSTLVTLLSQDESKPSKLRPAVPLASTASRPQRDDAMRACKGGGLLWLPRFSSDGDDTLAWRTLKV